MEPHETHKHRDWTTTVLHTHKSPMTSGAIALGALAVFAASAGAQTDYYNTDRGRPVRVEDAAPLEFRALEIQAAPFRVERSRAGVYHWAIEPEIAIGFMPRAHFELGAPLVAIDRGGRKTTGLAGIEIAGLYNFNAETTIPALAVAVDALLPVGSLASNRTFISGTGIVTKTFRQARIHVNAQYTLGDAPDASDDGVVEASRWMAGVAIDKAYALRSLLLTAEVFASQPLHADEALEWTAGTGARYQVSPRWALDAGVGRRFAGADPSWYATVGTAYAFGLPWRR
jgi:hypothetical protein